MSTLIQHGYEFRAGIKNDMDSSPSDDRLTPLFPEVTIHHIASDSEVERLIQNTDENL